MTSTELQALQAEVRAWLAENIPSDLAVPQQARNLDPSLAQWALEFRRKFGAKGWLASTWPTYFGGGGLSPAAGRVIQEELSRHRLPPLPVNRLWFTALRV